MNFVWQRMELGIARRAERRALEKLGATLPPSPRVAAVDARIDEIDRAIPLSLVRDRADWTAVAFWVRWLVALRGIVDRAVLRALRHHALADRAAARAELALAAVDSAQGETARVAQAAHQRALKAAESLQPLPLAVAEAHHLGGAVAKELRGHLVPKMPALVGLAVGGWIAHTFTDSQLRAVLHSWGFGEGPRHAISSDTLRLMNFWLPLLAAAACSYLGARLAALIEARYGADAAEGAR
jgi:hypothetical protein